MVRPARARSRWTTTRQGKRRDYDRYMASGAWATQRAAWYAEEAHRTGAPATCRVCGSRADLELHHLDYGQLGHERHEDLTALCRTHHRALHSIYDASYVWRKLGRRSASIGIIGSLRQSL